MEKTFNVTITANKTDDTEVDTKYEKETFGRVEDILGAYLKAIQHGEITSFVMTVA